MLAPAIMTIATIAYNFVRDELEAIPDILDEHSDWSMWMNGLKVLLYLC